MNDTEHETPARRIRTLPPVEIDCSTWLPAVPADPATFTVVKRVLPPLEIDCSRWDARAPEPQLTVSVQFEDGELSDSFVQAIHRTDPNAHVERASATVVLALPNHTAVAALFGAFRGLEAAGCVIGSERGAFHVRRKAS